MKDAAIHDRGIGESDAILEVPRRDVHTESGLAQFVATGSPGFTGEVVPHEFLFALGIVLKHLIGVRVITEQNVHLVVSPGKQQGENQSSIRK